MRNFLYLDTDFLTSFIAQIENGLVDETHTEMSDSNQREKSRFGISLGLKFALFNKRPSIRTLIKASKTTSTKKRHDDIFNIFDFYMDKKKLYQDKENIELGSYLKAPYNLNFINFTRIETLFNKKLRQTYAHYSNEEDFSFESFYTIRKNLSFLKTTTPYNTFLCGENIFIPIIDEFLRGDETQIGFSFEGSVTVIGQVKKVAGSISENQVDVVKKLNAMQNVSFSVLKKLGFVNRTAKENGAEDENLDLK